MLHIFLDKDARASSKHISSGCTQGPTFCIIFSCKFHQNLTAFRSHTIEELLPDVLNVEFESLKLTNKSSNVTITQ